MRINEILTEGLSNQVLFHGSNQPITQFKIPPYGVFFSPHKEWAEHYGNVITPVKVNASKVYLVNYENDIDEKIVDALFDRDYKTLAKFVQLLRSKGYQALQTVSDSEMVCVFPGTEIKILTQKINKILPESVSSDLVSTFLKSISPKELRLYSVRDNCGPAALHMKDWAEGQGINLQRYGGYFTADNVVYDKADFTKDMKKEFLRQGLNFNDTEARKQFIETNPKYSEEWKKIPHYWLQDSQGQVYDPTGYIQFVKTGLAKDLNSARYTGTPR